MKQPCLNLNNLPKPQHGLNPLYARMKEDDVVVDDDDDDERK